LLDEIRDANVVHFAGHGVSVPDRPLESALVVAPAGDASCVTASDIVPLRLEHVALVFLSTCGSASGARQRDGVQNLVTAFLAAGAPTVVASMDEVEDRSAGSFAMAFHRHFANSRDAASALRDATRELELKRQNRADVRIFVIGGTRDFLAH